MRSQLECGCIIDDARFSTYHFDAPYPRWAWGHYPLEAPGPESFCKDHDFFRPCQACGKEAEAARRKECKDARRKECEDARQEVIAIRHQEHTERQAQKAATLSAESAEKRPHTEAAEK